MSLRPTRAPIAEHFDNAVQRFLIPYDELKKRSENQHAIAWNAAIKTKAEALATLLSKTRKKLKTANQEAHKKQIHLSQSAKFIHSPSIEETNTTREELNKAFTVMNLPLIESNDDFAVRKAQIATKIDEEKANQMD